MTAPRHANNSGPAHQNGDPMTVAELDPRARALLDLWFGPPGDPGREQPRAKWFERSDAFDADLRRRFAEDQHSAATGTYDGWLATPEGAVALALLLDQVPRNIHRDSAAAFASDAKARQVAQAAIERGFDQALPAVWRWFLYLPFEHSEDAADQDRGVALFRALPSSTETDKVAVYAEQHREIIRRFGRFPHRNAVLGRRSTPEEDAFLRQPNSSF
jgi:uncharacterized protein (DUF924 family)